MNKKPTAKLALRRERGFTMLELMIAMTIGIFLLGALLVIVQTNKQVFGNQNKLSQLQDAERMAVTMMTDVIQSAGYFPDPTHNTYTSTLTAIAPFASGESVNGQYNPTLPGGDTISVRYMTASGDGILKCDGLPNTSGANQIYVNSFQVVGNQLICSVGGANYNLVSGVTNLQIYYGIKANLAAAGNDVDTYVTADKVPSWGNVMTVRIILTFTNPLYNAAAPQGQPATFQLQRVVAVMNKQGPIV
jgi:type IV pilus assembly protein PilW